MYFVAACICVTTAHGPRLTQHPLMHYHSAWAPGILRMHKRIWFVSIRCNNQVINVCIVIIWCILVRKHLVVVDAVRNPFFYVMFEHRSMDFGMRNLLCGVSFCTFSGTRIPSYLRIAVSIGMKLKKFEALAKLRRSCKRSKILQYFEDLARVRRGCKSSKIFRQFDDLAKDRRSCKSSKKLNLKFES